MTYQSTSPSSGLPYSTLSGPLAAPSSTAKNREVPNIYITFKLKESHNIINVAEEIKQVYGIAACYPHLAARKERQRQMSTAIAALYQAEGGQHKKAMSVGLKNEYNLSIGGLSDDASTCEIGGKKKRQEKYDMNDSFIDDTEMDMEQQVPEDGFFVWSGPLVTREKSVVERHIP